VLYTQVQRIEVTKVTRGVQDQSYIFLLEITNWNWPLVLPPLAWFGISLMYAIFCFLPYTERSAEVRVCCLVLSYSRTNNKIICFSQTQQYFIIYFKLLATSFGHSAIIRSSLQEILKQFTCSAYKIQCRMHYM